MLESKFNFDPDQNDFYFEQIDPDPSYALTFDNMVKMLAIQMRFRFVIVYNYDVYTVLIIKKLSSFEQAQTSTSTIVNMDRNELIRV